MQIGVQANFESKSPWEFFVVRKYLLILDETVYSLIIVKFYAPHMEVVDLLNKTVRYRIIDNIIILE